MHRGVMTQTVLAVKQRHMAQLHNIKQFGGGAYPLPKQHSDLANSAWEDRVEERRNTWTPSRAFLKSD